jgi:hypothetical protein
MERLRASVRHTSVRNVLPPICFGHIDPNDLIQFMGCFKTGLNPDGSVSRI